MKNLEEPKNRRPGVALTTVLLIMVIVALSVVTVVLQLGLKKELRQRIDQENGLLRIHIDNRTGELNSRLSKQDSLLEQEIGKAGQRIDALVKENLALKAELREGAEGDESLLMTRFDDRMRELCTRMEQRDVLFESEIEKARMGMDALGSENEELRIRLEKAQEAEKRARRDLRRQIELIEREKKELDIQRKLFDETLALLGTGEKSAEGEKDSGHEGLKAPDSGLLAQINRLLTKYSEEGLMIAECERIEGSTIHKPVMRAQSFLGEGSAVFLSEQAVFTSSENTVEVRCYGGVFQKEGESAFPVPASGLKVASWTLDPDEDLNTRLSEVLGIPVSPLAKNREAGLSPEELILEKLNTLLLKERSGKYVMKTIDKIEIPLLIDVEFEKYEPGGEVANRVVAKSCEIFLYEKERYVEFLFKNGFFITDDQKKSFYNDIYRLPIPNIEPGRWIEASLDCVTVK